MNTGQKHPWRYTLRLISERRDRTVFAFSMPVWAVAMLGLVGLAMLALLVVVVVTSTPLRRYLPGYLDLGTRAEMTRSAMRLDSLDYELSMQQAYLATLVAAMGGDTPVAEVERYDSARTHLGDTLLAASDREAAYRARHSERERFALASPAPGLEPAFRASVAPVRGTLLPAAKDEAAPGVRLGVERETTVVAPWDCTIVGQQYVVGQGWEVTMAAVGDYVAVYSRLTLALREVGATVKAGAAIGHTGAQADPADRWMGVRLWHKGALVDAAEAMAL